MPLEEALDTVGHRRRPRSATSWRASATPGRCPCPGPAPARLRRAAHRAGSGARGRGRRPSARSPACRASRGRSSTDHRPVEPRRAPRRWRMRHDAGYVAAARSPTFVRELAARAWAATRSAPSGGSQLHPEPRQRGRRPRPRSPSTCATPTTPCSRRPSAAWPRCLERARRGRGRRRSTARSLARFEPVDVRPSGGRPGRGARRSGLGHSARRMPSRRRPRRPDAGPRLPDRDGLRAERTAASATTRPSTPTPADLEAGANVLLHVAAAPWPTGTSTATARSAVTRDR